MSELPLLLSDLVQSEWDTQIADGLSMTMDLRGVGEVVRADHFSGLQ